MLENYIKLENGLIKQINKKPFIYGSDYTKGYDKYGIEKKHMSYLRLGHIIGSIGKIPDKLLDVGYGQGYFLDVAKDIIPKCFGNDVTEECPLPAGCSFVKDIYNETYDIVTFFDVLEHFENIYDIKNLKTQYICVSMPWCNYKNSEWFQSWKHRRPDEHLWFFNEKSLTSFMNEIGFKKINTCNIEDSIRKDSNNQPNILSGVFEKI
jgi:hypothetical protein